MSELLKSLKRSKILFYPGAGEDWGAFLRLADMCDTFVLCDWNVGENSIRSSLSGLRLEGYSEPKITSLSADDLRSGENRIGDTDWLSAQESESYKTRLSELEPNGWGLMASFSSATDGKLIRLIYLGAEGVATYQQLFNVNNICPEILVLIRTDGFSGNWTSFHDWKAPLASVARENEAGLPGQLVVLESKGPGRSSSSVDGQTETAPVSEPDSPQASSLSDASLERRPATGGDFDFLDSDEPVQDGEDYFGQTEWTSEDGGQYRQVVQRINDWHGGISEGAAKLLLRRAALDWIYLFTNKASYPEPIAEIDDLCSLEDDEENVFLLLADMEFPPMSRASKGESVGLCTSKNGSLMLHGTAIVGGDCSQRETPASVAPIYSEARDRTHMPPKWVPLVNLNREVSRKLPSAYLSQDEQKTFMIGQAFVKKLNNNLPQIVAGQEMEIPPDAPTEFTFPTTMLPENNQNFTVIGLDPTAATWPSRMTEGPKDMPSITLKWNGTEFRVGHDALKEHTANSDFWEEVESSGSVLCCIDGPCATNGPCLLPDISAWDPNGNQGRRGAERELSRLGVNLFWTTQNTVMRWPGASRWIARSLVLFSEENEHDTIETHPHGAFTFLWRLFGRVDPLPKKKNTLGRNARVAMLKSFIPGLNESIVPDDDAVDAAVAALVAGLHKLDLTESFGATDDGGKIWMPDIEKLQALTTEVE